MSGAHDSDHYDIQFTTRQLALLFGLLTVIVVGVFVGGIVIGRGMMPAAAETIAARRATPPPEVAETMAPTPAGAAETASAGEALRLPISQPISQPISEPPAERSPAPPARMASTNPEQLSSRSLGATERPVPPPSAPVTRPAPARVAPAAAASGGRFTIQVAAFRDRAAAERMLLQLAAKGMEGYLEGTPAGIFRVRVGEFETREAARTVAAQLEGEQFATLVTSR